MKRYAAAKKDQAILDEIVEEFLGQKKTRVEMIASLNVDEKIIIAAEGRIA